MPSGLAINISGGWIGTFSGLRFNLLHPHPDMMCIEDVAHHLSLTNRFTGATPTAYNVAHHAVLVSEVCEPGDARWGLMHDNAEAWYSDVNRNLKQTDEMAGYRRLEDRGMEQVCLKWGLPSQQPSSVSAADIFMGRIERASFFQPSHPLYATMPPGFKVIIPWTAADSEQAFLTRYRELFLNQ